MSVNAFAMEPVVEVGRRSRKRLPSPECIARKAAAREAFLERKLAFAAGEPPRRPRLTRAEALEHQGGKKSMAGQP